MLDDDIVAAARQLLDICKRKNTLIATAESCTAGLVAGTLTELPGVSSILDRGYVTYSNEAKHQMLGVSRETLDRYGAVSRQTAEEMVRGVLGHSRVHLVVSVTGIAGPDGGSAEKPVGTFWVGLSSAGKTEAFHYFYPAERNRFRLYCTTAALDLVRRHLAGLSKQWEIR